MNKTGEVFALWELVSIIKGVDSNISKTITTGWGINIQLTVPLRGLGGPWQRTPNATETQDIALALKRWLPLSL